ncbi:MAG: TRAP transporter small permease [Hydrogenophaga sp.]|uniref:TRAP transporter small permease n=1 Tax=Hydrogenophaga sp. TaxID=1904254 RepID=UPI0025BD2580|nr:TRAP transporter small permease [Hydrogenophaga sp.]MBT9550887.1 TRAP transporter small permease [Hydrogenophaga sp.]
MINHLIDRYCRVVETLIALALAVMVLLVFGNVVLRYVFNSGIAISEEMSRWLFVWVTFMGAVVAVKEKAHLGTDFLLVRLPPFVQRTCLVISYLLMLYCTWLLFSGALTQTLINADVEAPVSGFSMAIFYASGVFFAVSSGLMLLRQLWLVLSGQVRDEDLVHIQESEELTQIDGLHLDRSDTYK